MKRWRHWCVTDERFILTLTLADVGYLGVAALWLVDLATGRTHSATALRRRMDLETFAGAPAIAFLDGPGGTRLRARARGLRADLLAAAAPGEEHLSVQVHAVRTNKHVARPVTGTVVVDGRVLAVAAAHATLDESHGDWPFATRWNWGVAQGVRAGRRVGVNLGARWTDGSGVTENALFVDGRVRPLAGDVAFSRWAITPTKTRVAGSSTAPEPGFPRVTGAGVDLVLEPLCERMLYVPLLARTRVAFGRWRGTVEDVSFDGLLGWAEEVDVRW